MMLQEVFGFEKGVIRVIGLSRSECPGCFASGCLCVQFDTGGGLRLLSALL